MSCARVTSSTVQDRRPRFYCHLSPRNTRAADRWAGRSEGLFAGVFTLASMLPGCVFLPAI